MNLRSQYKNRILHFSILNILEIHFEEMFETSGLKNSDNM